MPDFSSHLQKAWSGSDWRKVLSDGGEMRSASSLNVSLSREGIAKLSFSLPKIDGDGPFVLLANPSPMLSDGSGANLV